MTKAKGKIKNEHLKRKYRRKLSVRRKVVGTSDRPRLSVTKSNKNLYLQVIDDTTSRTLLSVQSFGKNAPPGASDNKEGAKLLGGLLADKLKEKNIATLVFDRGGNKYTGVLAQLADTIRERGIRI